MNSSDKTILEKFTKELTILHYAMTFGAFMLACVIYFFTMSKGHFSFSNTDDIFLFICPLVAIGGIVGGLIIYRKRVEKIDRSAPLEEKLADFRAARIMKYALAEGPALICVVAAMETQNLLYIAIAGVMILYLFTMKVSEDGIVEELGL